MTRLTVPLLAVLLAAGPAMGIWVACLPLGYEWKLGPLSGYRWCEGARVSLGPVSVLVNVERLYATDCARDLRGPE